MESAISSRNSGMVFDLLEQSVQRRKSRGLSRQVGLELEMFLVDTWGVPADGWKFICSLLSDYGDSWVFQAAFDSSDMNLQITHKDTGATLELDAGRSTLEVGLPASGDLGVVWRSQRLIATDLIEAAKSQGLHILTLGLQPCATSVSWTKRQRYEALQAYFRSSLDDLTRVGACQIHLDLYETDEISKFAWIGSAFSGLLSSLTANSPVLGRGIARPVKSYRAGVWPRYFPSNRTGLLADYESCRPHVDTEACINAVLCVPKVVEKDTSGVYHACARGTFLSDGATPDELQLHFGTNWHDVRVNLRYGTMEFRMCCEQTLAMQLALAAFWLGVSHNLDAAYGLAQTISFEQASQWRELSSYGMDWLEDHHLALLETVLGVAKAGLQATARSHLLLPLCEYLAERRCPADDAIEVYKSQGVEGLLSHTSLIV